jgi:hypothetical protein
MKPTRLLIYPKCIPDVPKRNGVVQSTRLTFVHIKSLHLQQTTAIKMHSKHILLLDSSITHNWIFGSRFFRIKNSNPFTLSCPQTEPPLSLPPIIAGDRLKSPSRSAFVLEWNDITNMAQEELRYAINNKIGRQMISRDSCFLFETFSNSYTLPNLFFLKCFIYFADPTYIDQSQSSFNGFNEIANNTEEG